LRGLVLTADGSKIATASVKGTVLRVFDVATATCLHEFRRGVERATITCLAFSWDYKWLACTSDKGTAHVFQVEEDKETKPAESSSLTQLFFSTVRRSVEGDAKKSVCQIRGVPHPQACAFVAEATNLLAIAGWDADSNGVLLLAEFGANEEAKRVGYHVLCRSAVPEETEEARRRRRLRGSAPLMPQTPEGGKLYIGDRLEINGMDQIRFEETDEFIAVTAITAEDKKEMDEGTTVAKATTPPASISNPPDETTAESGSVSATADGRSSNVDSGIGDSVTTEPLDDEGGSSETI
jgi:hypothetical protein